MLGTIVIMVALILFFIYIHQIWLAFIVALVGTGILIGMGAAKQSNKKTPERTLSGPGKVDLGTFTKGANNLAEFLGQTINGLLGVKPTTKEDEKKLKELREAGRKPGRESYKPVHKQF